jgi:hypothetical protein
VEHSKRYVTGYNLIARPHQGGMMLLCFAMLLVLSEVSLGGLADAGRQTRELHPEKTAVPP